MKLSALILVFCSLFMTGSLMAEEPQSKAEQCAQYGSYQDADGNWQTCSEDEMPSEEEAE